MFTLALTPGWEQAVARLEAFPARARKLLAWALRTLVLRLKRKVLQVVPDTAEYRTYRRSLEVFTVRTEARVTVEGLRVGLRARKVKKVFAKRTVLYVKPRGARRPSPAVEVLAKYGPWTLDTLPFYPRKRDAQVVSRMVTEREVLAVEKQRRKDRPRWRQALSKAGVRPPKARNKVAVPRSARALADLAFEGLRLELGLAGTPPRPHWGPAIRSSRAALLRLLRTSPVARKILASRPGAPVVRLKRIPKVRPTEARALLGVAKRLR